VLANRPGFETGMEAKAFDIPAKSSKGGNLICKPGHLMAIHLLLTFEALLEETMGDLTLGMIFLIVYGCYCKTCKYLI